jgi:hypothetical protein
MQVAGNQSLSMPIRFSLPTPIQRLGEPSPTQEDPIGYGNPPDETPSQGTAARTSRAHETMLGKGSNQTPAQDVGPAVGLSEPQP